jgi:hypothetical protein
MACFVCDAKGAVEVFPPRDVKEIHCRDCGRYEITGTATAVITAHPLVARLAALAHAQAIAAATGGDPPPLPLIKSTML